MQKIETIILSKLFSDEDYARKVIPFITPEYFHDTSERKIFNYAREFIEKYNSLPTVEAIEIAVQNDRGINENEFKNINEKLTHLDDSLDVNEKWLLEETEKFCKDKAVYNAIMQSIQIIDGDDKSLKKQFAPIVKDELLHTTSFNNVTLTSNSLSENYNIQVNPREINLFYIEDDLRERIIFENNIYKVNNTEFQFTETEILNELKNYPEKEPLIYARSKFVGLDFAELKTN